MWTLHKQQQHRGAQLHARSGKPRQPGEVPAEAGAAREAQEHDRAGDQSLQAGEYPASPIEHRDQDNTPSAPRKTRIPQDGVIQPYHRHERGGGEDK